MALTLWWAVRVGGALLLLLSFPLLIELCLLTSASLLPRRRLRAAGKPLIRLAIIVPAHNEERLIGRCVESLIAHRPADVAIYVVAHNCSDRTAEIALHAGAEVVRMDDPRKTGKACALRHGFEHALCAGAGAVGVIDADSVVSTDLLLNMQAALSGADEAVQCEYRVLSRPGQRTASLTAIAFQGFNLVRPLGRERLRLSVGIFGNGFALRREVLERVPYLADSVVEDLEYHIELVRAGKRVRFLEGATVFGEMPDGGTGRETQRARWEGGRLLMMRTFPLRLAGDIVRGRLQLFEPLLDVLSLPLAMEVQCLMLLLMLPVSWCRWYAVGGLSVLCLHYLAAAKAGENFWRSVAVLGMVPRYLFWKLVLLPKILLASRRNASWVRTHRGETDFHRSPSADALE